MVAFNYTIYNVLRFFLTVRTYKTSQTKFNFYLFTTPLYKNLFPVCSIYHHHIRNEMHLLLTCTENV